MSKSNSQDSETIEVACLGMMLANERRKQGVVTVDELVKEINRLSDWVNRQLQRGVRGE